jgi:dUTP pyrophosphatase
MKVKIKRFDKDFELPAPELNAACFDYVCRETVTVDSHEIKPIAQNVAYKVPDGYAMLMFTRSSTAKRKGLMLANNVGVIDPFYCGDKDEVLAFVYNFTDKPVTVEAGDRIVQGMLIKSEQVVWQEVDSMNDEGHGGYRHIDDHK